MRICALFDKYRDKELNAAERSEFESHLGSCEDCRTRKSLLDHVVFLVRSEEVQPVDMADRIARRAFLRQNSWAAEVISWLRPLPAMAALTLALVLFSSLWIISSNGTVSAYSEYEKLIEEADADYISARLSQDSSGNTIINWLEQEGNSQ
jgi:anti-sigma factor RsiW